MFMKISKSDIAFCGNVYMPSIGDLWPVEEVIKKNLFNKLHVPLDNYGKRSGIK